MDIAALNSVGGYYTGMYIIGLIMLFIAIANFALGIANAAICGFHGSIGYGIWGSALCFLAALTGIFASRSRRRSVIVTHMVFAILAAVSAVIQLAMGAVSAVIDYHALQQYLLGPNSASRSSQSHVLHNYGCSPIQQDIYFMTTRGPTATDALLASFAILQGLFAVTTAAFSCRATVCPPGIDTMPWQGSQQQLVRA